MNKGENESKVYKSEFLLNISISSLPIVAGIITFVAYIYFGVIYFNKIFLLLPAVPFFIGIYLWWKSLMKVFVSDRGLHIAGAFIFPKKIQWEDIISINTQINTYIFWKIPKLIIEFSQGGKNRKTTISSITIVKYKDLTENIVKRAAKAEIDDATKDFLEGKLGHPEVTYLKVVKILDAVLLVFIYEEAIRYLCKFDYSKLIKMLIKSF